MEKALYIFEFYLEGEPETSAEWFVADDNISYEQQLQECFKYLFELHGDEGEKIEDFMKNYVVENVYRVDNDLIDEVYKSRKQ